MATITKRGKSWFAQVRRKGISKSASFPTKGAAQAWATHTESEILSGKHLSASEKTLRDAIVRYSEIVTPSKKSASKEQQHINLLLSSLPFVDCLLSEVSTPMIAQWRDDRLKHVKPGTVIRNFSLLGAILETARLEWQWIDKNPVRDVRRPASPRHRDGIYTDEQIDLVTSRLPPIAKSMFLFAIETAMRRGEMLALLWEDIAGSVATLRDSKNGDKRHVPLSAKAVQILEGNGHLDKPFPISIHSLEAQFEKAKIPGLVWHDTRHTAITRLARKLDVLTLARMIGHRDLKSLMIYYNESAEDIAKKL